MPSVTNWGAEGLRGGWGSGGRGMVDTGIWCEGAAEAEAAALEDAVDCTADLPS